MKDEVELVDVDMCHFGIAASDEYGEALAMKRTKVMTNSHEVARRTERKCDGSHRHVLFVAGEAKKAQLYPRAFCWTVCEGIAPEKRRHALGLYHHKVLSLGEISAAVEKLPGKVRTAD